MGPVLNMTVGYLLPKRLFHVGSALIIFSRKLCPAAATMKSLLKPTGLVWRMNDQSLMQNFDKND